MIAVLTDSTCDLPIEEARKLGIHIIPLTVHMQERELLDWQEIDPDDVYSHMKAGGTASTTPVAVAAFATRYRELLDTHDEVVSIHLSGKLSETVNHARRAVALLNMERRIHVVDSGLASTPLAEAALAARTALLSGGIRPAPFGRPRPSAPRFTPNSACLRWSICAGGEGWAAPRPSSATCWACARSWASRAAS